MYGEMDTSGGLVMLRCPAGLLTGPTLMAKPGRSHPSIPHLPKPQHTTPHPPASLLLVFICQPGKHTDKTTDNRLYFYLLWLTDQQEKTTFVMSHFITTHRQNHLLSNMQTLLHEIFMSWISQAFLLHVLFTI